MREDEKLGKPTRDPEPAEVAYEPPQLEEIKGDDRATAGAWITPFPDNDN